MMKLEVTASTHLEVSNRLREMGRGHRVWPGGVVDMDGVKLHREPGAAGLHSADLEAGSRGGWNETYSGVRFYTFDPRAEDVRIADIAHSLALQCRYSGNSRRFYSVAEHCCLLSDFVRHSPPWINESPHGVPVDPRQDALIALMHDAAEAYIGDLARPVKHRLPAFKEMEARIEAVIFPVYGLPPELPGWMRELDSRILCDERRQVMLTQHNEWSTDQLEPLGARVRFWGPARAEYEFLRRFYELSLGKGYYAARGLALRMTRGSRPWWGMMGGH